MSRYRSNKQLELFDEAMFSAATVLEAPCSRPFVGEDLSPVFPERQKAAAVELLGQLLLEIFDKSELQSEKENHHAR
jgi:hypothetical protein